MDKLTGNIESDSNSLGKKAGIDKCFDIKGRYLKIGGRRAFFCYAATYANDLLTEQVVSRYINSNIMENDNATSFGERCGSFGFIKYTDDLDECANEIFEGSSALLVDGFKSALVCDTKQIPSRSVDEPESDRVLRGSRDGFTEKLNDNICLLRLRLKTQDLVLKKLSVGKATKTSVILCYINGRADEKFVNSLENKINSIEVDALSMSQESLAECLVKRKWYNPFPKFRYTERPDAASAMMLEGSVIVRCENSPQAMILPCSIFDFLQETDDFYFPPLTGTYLRIVRMSVFLVSLFLVPIWFLFVKNPDIIPSFLSFIKPHEFTGLPIVFQILLVEFTVDGLKLASINTPGSLNNSLSVVAGLIIGDFAIEVGWLMPDVILYMSFVTMANFTQPSFELGYAFKFMRILLVILIALFNYIGLAVGILAIIFFIILNNSVSGGRSYLYPLIPFNKDALVRLFFRVKLKPNMQTGKTNTKKSG